MSLKGLRSNRMGYTRFWGIKKQLDTEKFKEYSQTCRIVCQSWEEYQISKGDLDYGLAGWDGYGEPTFTDTEVCFNGRASESERDLSHETFMIKSSDSQGFKFCKTARKPYDRQVLACLYLAKKFFSDDIEVRSDEWESDSEIISFVVGFLRDDKIKIIFGGTL